MIPTHTRSNVGAFPHQPDGCEPTRVEVRGWIVDVVGDAVVIPEQALSPGMAVWDLTECLQAATTLASNHRRESRPYPRQQPTPQPPSQLRIAAILLRARDIAATTWHPVNHDITTAPSKPGRMPIRR